MAIAGGDTRTGWTNRQNGNKLVAKIRPLFIMHGGDYTNANTASEMSSYLNDWQLTFSADSIDGLNYKRIYPFVATHGNHEDDNYKTLCQVFGVDYDINNVCDAKDTYGAFNVSPLLRVYTLNSQ
ncbi:metallophosphoesterase [Pseudoalteromonas phenolica]|uniref:metallophosphoesterase n=1 Tax=Pseudoalteromonas phenolica TaxID=161398 RepID=UPI00320B4A40